MPTEETTVADEAGVAPIAEPSSEEPSESSAAMSSDEAPNAAAEEASEAASTPELERQRLEEQLAQLKRREAELRRAIAMTDHPELTDAIRELEGRAYVVAKAEDRLAQPLSSAEERKRERLEKKLAGLRAKRDELDASIGALEVELAPLGDERRARLSGERDEALNGLFVTLARHAEAFERAGLQAAALLPELERWLPELRARASAAEA